MTLKDSGDLPKALAGQFARSNVALALSDGQGDVPLLLVNDAFCGLTGYAAEDCIGHNCRFLQGPDTPEEQRAALRAFIEDETAEAGRFVILNYREDGSRFRNFVFMNRLRDGTGATRYFVASQFDMTNVERQARLAENDGELGRRLTDIEAIGRDYGMAMQGSAQILADSAAMLARLALSDRLS